MSAAWYRSDTTPLYAPSSTAGGITLEFVQQQQDFAARMAQQMAKCLPPRSHIPTTGVPMTSTTIVVTNGSVFKEFDTEAKAVEYATEQAHKQNETFYLLKVTKLVKPKRDVTIEEV